MRFTAAVTKEEKWYVARCLEVEVTSQGHTMDEALSNLREALELYFEDDTPVNCIENSTGRLANMHFKLKDSNGNIIVPFLNEDDKPVLKLNDQEYEILEPSYDDKAADAMAEWIADFDADPEIRQMIAESEQAIEKGHVYTTKQVIEMIKNGEI